MSLSLKKKAVFSLYVLHGITTDLLIAASTLVLGEEAGDDWRRHKNDIRFTTLIGALVVTGRNVFEAANLLEGAPRNGWVTTGIFHALVKEKLLDLAEEVKGLRKDIEDLGKELSQEDVAA